MKIYYVNIYLLKIIPLQSGTVLRQIFVHMIFVAFDFEAIYFMFKTYYMRWNLYQKKALLI